MKIILLLFVLLLSSAVMAQVSTIDYKKVEQTNTLALEKFFSAKAELHVGGTEYMRGMDNQGKIFAHLVVENSSLDNSICLTSAWLPDNSGKLLADEYMAFLEDGVYIKDFSIPSNMQLGVYPISVKCYFPINRTFYNASSYQVYNGSYASGSVNDTRVYDNIFLRFSEALIVSVVRTVNTTINMTANLTNFTENVILEFGGEWNGGAGAAGEDVKISLYNFSSSSWTDLPNLIIDAAPQAPINVTNSFPRPFSDYFSSGIVGVKFEDVPAGTDGTNSNLDIDRLQVLVINNATLGMNGVRGTSELHVTENIVLEILKSEIEEMTLSNHNICADNMTLTHVLSKIRCIDTDCVNISQNMSEPCQYGCNDKEVPNSCNPSPFQVNLWLIGLFLAVIIILAALFAKRG